MIREHVSKTKHGVSRRMSPPKIQFTASLVKVVGGEDSFLTFYVQIFFSPQGNHRL
jgi:hypothetical protein